MAGLAMIGTLSAAGTLLAGLPVLLNAAAYAARRHLLAGAKRAPRAVPPPGPSLLPFLRECAATALAMGGVPLPRRVSSGATGGPLAVMLPEAGLSTGALRILRRRLREIGWASIVGVRRTAPNRLDEAVAELARRIESVPAEHTLLSLIGHGSGGLVGRAYLLGPVDPRVRQLVTLGTPHQGTLALHTRLPGCRSLRPESSLLHRLGADARAPDSPERVAIYSEFDAWVVPVEAAYWPGAFNIQVRGFGHFSLLTSRRVFELLAENLAREPQRPRA